MGRRISNKLNIFAAITVLFCLVLCGCKGKNIILTTEFEEDELMRISTSRCFLPEMMLYLVNAQDEYEEVYGKEIWNQSLNGVKLSDTIKDRVLAQIAQVKVMNLMAVDYEITLSDSEKELIEQAGAAYFNSLNSREKELLGVTEEIIRQVYTEYVVANRVYDYIIRDINPEISDDEARTITVQHILIKTYALDGDGNRIEYTEKAKQDAYNLLARIRREATEPGADGSDPVDFELLAAEYNEDDDITYSFGRGEMAKAFEDAAFNLDNGEISEIVTTEYGFHLIKCVSTFDVEETQRNKVRILQERKEKVFKETYNEYIKGIKKNLNEELYDSIELILDENVTTKGMFSEEYLGGL